MKWFRWTNWDRLQHYAEPSPPWAKVYARILDPSNDWYRLDDVQSGQAVRLIALACRRENTMPFDPDLIRDEINATHPVDLQVFVDLGMAQVFDTRAQCLAAEHARLAARPNKRSESKRSDSSASKDAIVSASVDASLREQRTENRVQSTEGTFGSGLPVSSEGDLGTETEHGRDGAPPQPADAPAVPSLLDKEAGKESVWNAWAASLATQATDPPELVAAYVEALVAACSARYAETGGKFTPTRRAKLATALSKFDPDPILFGIEAYVDRHAATKDERYLTGIVRRLSRMSEKELSAEIRRHRQAMNGCGLVDIVTEDETEGG